MALAKGPCDSDARKFCNGVSVAKGRLGKCLREHFAELSPACKELQSRAVASMAKEGEEPCHADIKKHCAEIKPGGGRLEECLKAHEAELAPSCRARLLK
jgi:hypothetical protein